MNDLRFEYFQPKITTILFYYYYSASRWIYIYTYYNHKSETVTLCENVDHQSTILEVVTF